MNSQIEPKLAPPGAGLPAPALFIARLMFLFQRLTGSRDSFTALFKRERELIRALVRACEGDDGARRVLIKRVPGMEDSSRHWSVWMTLDHLRIVNGSMTGVIEGLAKGVSLPGKASTADVKPSPEVTAAVITDYEKSCDTFLATVASVDNLKTALRFLHPWFGPLDAAGWHAIAGVHMGIHRVQIERIVAEIKLKPAA